jgi:phosphoribosylglycinamide formyltransferase-1
MTEKLNLAILVSGRGSVLKTLLAACERGDLDAEVVAAASNKECPALEVARAAGVPTVTVHRLEDHGSRAERDAKMAASLAAAGVDFVVVGGFDEVLAEEMISPWPDRIISMYPAVLPAFGELGEAIGPALDLGVKLIGVTIHFRTANTLSTGPIIAQEPLPVALGETFEEITARVIELESCFIPRVLAEFGEGRVTREGHRVRVAA